MASDVVIKPGPPWEPTPGDTAAAVPTQRWNLDDPHDRKLRSQLRWSVMFLALIFVGFACSIAFNFAQAARTGGGSGFGDTVLLPQDEAERFFETRNIPDSNH